MLCFLLINSLAVHLRAAPYLIPLLPSRFFARYILHSFRLSLAIHARTYSSAGRASPPLAASLVTWAPASPLAQPSFVFEATS